MLQGVLDVSKDVDAELGGPTKPLTVEGVLHALDALDLDNSKASRKWCGLFDDDASSAPSSILAGGADVVVVGRSAKLGLPLAKALISRDATVTVVHSQTRAITLANAVKSADVVFSCAGSPGLITASMLKEGSVVFNVGTKYDAPTKTLSADAADDVASVARLLTPTPHGIGPLCTAVLARRVVRRAEERALKIPDGLPASWAVLEKNASTCATRSVSFPSLSAAVEALKAVSAVGDSLGHHPTANLNEAQACEQVHGCVLRTSLTTFSKGKRLTPLDVKAAVAIDAALEAVQRRPALDVQKLDYHLPDERIARYPASPRGSSKLLHRSADGVLKDYRFDTDLVNTLPKDAILVVNESRVVHGRVAAKLDGSTLEAFEVMLLNPAAKGDSAYPADAVSSKADGQTWLAMIRRAATKKGDVLHVAAGVSLTVEGVVGQWIEEGEKDGVEALVRFHVAENETMDAVLQKVGEVPLPPYLRRAPDDSDTTAYQTAYAQEAGSVAAPTAGLHFTPKVLEAVRASGRTIVAVALHVGAGTFKPLTSPNLADHDMHAEHFSIKKTALTQLRDAALQNRPIVAVGTTAARALESLAALSRCSNGVQSGKVCSLGHLKQWQAYDDASTSTAGLSAASAFDAVLDAAGGCDEVRASTSLCIAPGFQFQIVDSLVTNFHHPDSTLVALVAALVGGEGETHSLYSHALEKDYRFLSYGDACLLDNPAAASKQRRGD